MFVVTVVFQAAEGQAAAMRARLVKQAADSLAKEPACKRFDVAEDPTVSGRFYLYEVYDDEAGFETHRGMPHYAGFQEDMGPLTASKAVETWTLASPLSAKPA